MATENDIWIDRARIFQLRISKLTDDYGIVDSSINDINPEPAHRRTTASGTAAASSAVCPAALALRTADEMIKELPAVATPVPDRV
jgi:hypothetical protein